MRNPDCKSTRNEAGVGEQISCACARGSEQPTQKPKSSTSERHADRRLIPTSDLFVCRLGRADKAPWFKNSIRTFGLAAGGAAFVIGTAFGLSGCAGATNSEGPEPAASTDAGQTEWSNEAELEPITLTDEEIAILQTNDHDQMDPVWDKTLHPMLNKLMIDLVDAGGDGSGLDFSAITDDDAVQDELEIISKRFIPELPQQDVEVCAAVLNLNGMKGWCDNLMNSTFELDTDMTLDVIRRTIDDTMSQDIDNRFIVETNLQPHLDGNRLMVRSSLFE